MDRAGSHGSRHGPRTPFVLSQMAFSLIATIAASTRTGVELASIGDGSIGTPHAGPPPTQGCLSTGGLGAAEVGRERNSRCWVRGRTNRAFMSSHSRQLSSCERPRPIQLDVTFGSSGCRGARSGLSFGQSCIISRQGFRLSSNRLQDPSDATFREGD